MEKIYNFFFGKLDEKEPLINKEISFDGIEKYIHEDSYDINDQSIKKETIDQPINKETIDQPILAKVEYNIPINNCVESIKVIDSIVDKYNLHLQKIENKTQTFNKRSSKKQIKKSSKKTSKSYKKSIKKSSKKRS